MALPAYAMNQSSFPEMYERFLVEPLFRPFAAVVIERAAPRTRERVLDVACGTGIVARLAKVRAGASAHVVGVDTCQQMLEVARSVAPEIEWRHGHAQALPLADGETFDVVTCHQGLQFFPDRAGATREMRRAAGSRGRVVVACWVALEAIPFEQEIHRAAERHLGPIVDQRYSIRDPAELEDVLAEGGFQDIRVDTVARTVRFADGSVFLRMNAMALVGMSSRSKAMTDDERAAMVERLTAESTEVARAYTTPAGLAFDLATYLATATAS